MSMRGLCHYFIHIYLKVTCKYAHILYQTIRIKTHVAQNIAVFYDRCLTNFTFQNLNINARVGQQSVSRRTGEELHFWHGVSE